MFSSSQSVIPGPAASVSTENLLEVQILWSSPRTTESEILEGGVQQSVF